MDGKGKKKSKQKTKTKITLNDLKDLGGTKEDLNLIGDVDDDSNASDFENPGEDFDVDPINKFELREFVEKLEFYKYRPKPDDEDSDEDDSNVPDPKENKTKKGNIGGGHEGLDDDDVNTASKSTKGNKEKKSKKDKQGGKVTETEHSAEDVEEETVQQGSDSHKPTVTDENGHAKAKKDRNKYKSLVQYDEVSSTTKDSTQSYRTHMKKYSGRRYLLVKSGADYFDQQNEARIEEKPLSHDMMKQMENFAAKLLEDEINIYNTQKQTAKKSNVGWMKTVLVSGTLADKVAALTVLVQESPVHSLAHIDTLIAMTKKHVKRESLQAADALKDMFLTQLIPDKRKLMPFNQRPLSELSTMASGNKDNIDKKLILWYFEGQLKERYSLFVKSLQEMSHNPLAAVRIKAVSLIKQLLINKPEEEKTLLTLLLNKIGDPHYKLASTVTYSLLQLVEKHPNMKEVVVREVEYLLFRPNISSSAQYYSVCFLNQLKLSHYEKDLAVKLIKIYFAFFRANMKKGDVDSKMMSALLSGVNRAYPYAELEEGYLSGQIDNLYKLVHVVNFSTSVQALSLLYQVMDTSKFVLERYYTALYRKLADPGLKSASKPALFLNLLYKSLRADESERRRKAFIKRLLQVLFYQQAQFICGSLVLISEILKPFPWLLTLASQEEESDDEEHFVDEPDPDSDGEGIKTENTDENNAADIKVKKENNDVKVKKESKKARASWIHRKNINDKSDKGSYDPFYRNPQFCHADNECMWELEKLTKHYHPSVALFATQLLKGESIQYDGNPLQDFTIIRFLDRFVFKNPKKELPKEKRIATLDRVKYVPAGVKKVTVDSEEFLNLDENNVPVDDLFHYRYFARKALIKKQKGEEEDSDVDDDEFDDYLDKFEKNYDEGELAIGYDFASEFEKKIGQKVVDSSSEDEEDEDDMEDMTLGGEDLVEALSDEEVDFDDDEEFASALEDKMEGLLDDGLDDDDDDDEEDDVDDSKLAGFSDEDEEEEDGMGFDEEDISFSDDEDEFKDLLPKGKSIKRKAPLSDKAEKLAKKGRKSSGLDKASAFAAAEEFGDMMDENAGSLIDMTGSGALSTNDKAGVKQLKWEMERDKWIRGESWKEKKRTQFRKKNNFGGGKGPKGKFGKRK